MLGFPPLIIYTISSGQYSSPIESSIMQTGKNIHLLKPLVLLMLNLFFTTSSSIAQDGRPTSFCGKIRIQAPFLNPSSNESSSLLHRMIQCKSQKLYFRTSLGLFPVSSINYTRKFLTISHRRSCSSSLHYVSPLLLSAGFPSPPLPNSLLLFNCSNKRHPISPFVGNCSLFHACGAFSSEVQEQQEQPKVSPSCLLVDDLERVGVGFDPKHLNCSHYSHIHRSLADDHHSYEGYELGTRISFDVPDHVPNPCDECEKPNGNCGVGLRCMCHPKECSKHLLSYKFFFLFFFNRSIRASLD